MRFLTSALLLILASFFSTAVAGNVKNPMKSKYFDFDVADLVDFTIQQAPIDTNTLLANPQIAANTPINPAAFNSLPAINLQAQPGLNAALLNQMQAQPLQQGTLTAQQYQQLLQQQAAFANPLVGAQTVMNQLFPQQQQATLNAAALGYNPYMGGMNGYANQFGGAYPANNPAGVAGLVQQAAHQIVQAMNPGPGIGGGVNPFGPGVGGIGGVGGPVGLGGLGGIGGIGGPGPRP